MSTACPRHFPQAQPLRWLLEGALGRVAPPSHKTWLRELLEPVRKAHFPRLQLFLPFAHAAEGFGEARAALLRGAAPDGTCKEVVVLRDPPVVWVYNVVEHGRSTYREVVFCSRADCCLASLPSAPAEHSGVPVLTCGDAMAPAVDDASLVITRQVPVTLAGLPPFLAPASAGTPRRTKSADRFEFGSVSSPHGCGQGSV